MILPSTTETARRGTYFSSMALVGMVLLSVGLLLTLASMVARHRQGLDLQSGVLREALIICQHNGGAKTVSIKESSKGAESTMEVTGQCMDGAEIRKVLPNKDAE